MYLMAFCAWCLQVHDETAPFEEGLIALSSFGFGGANMHMVLQGSPGQRLALLDQGDANKAESDDEDDATGSKKPVGVAIPLAARTAQGLVYLAQVVKKVLRPVRPAPRLPGLRKSPQLQFRSKGCMYSCSFWAACSLQ